MTRNNRYFVWCCIVLCFSVLAVYWQISSHEFINYDDNVYLYDNEHIKDGLTAKSILWAFTSSHANNWHPLTWMSHMTDVELFGMNAGRHHLINLLFHLANSLLLFLFLNRVSCRIWPSFWCSMLFALHPLHVESVAWASERKDVLSCFFMLLTLVSYAGHVQYRSAKAYWGAVLFFALGLMSKPMLVSLPILLLILDFWPLARPRHLVVPDCLENSHKGFHVSSFLLREKIPFFILSSISCLVTIYVQQQSGALKSLQTFPATLRIANVLVSYVSYLGKTFYPYDLAIFYPYPEAIPLWMILGAAVILFSITVAAYSVKNLYPFVLAGWLWYVVSMLPVIGVLQVGSQAMADRYTYIPLIGIFMVVSFCVASWKGVTPGKVLPGALVLIAILATLSWRQIGFWKNSQLLFHHSLEVTRNNDTAHCHLGQMFAAKGDYAQAEKHYAAALAINPTSLEAEANLGVMLAEQGKIDQAYTYLSRAASNAPHNQKIQNNLANIYQVKGQFTEAVTLYKKVLAVEPGHKETLLNLATTLDRQELFHESILYYQKAIELYPTLAEAFNGLGVVYAKNGRMDEAIEHFRKAIALKPGYKQAENNLALAVSRGSSLP